ncbi:MAG: Fe-S cluster assembly protein IscX [Phycisphaerales bacterium]
MPHTYGWLDVDRIAEELAERHRQSNPLRVNFVDLKRMVQELPGFAEEPGHPCNERILETIQAKWLEEKQDLDKDEEDGQ